MKKLFTIISVCTMIILSSCMHQNYIYKFVNCTEEDLTIVLGYTDKRSDTTLVINKGTNELSEVMEIFCNLPPMATEGKILEYFDYEEYEKYIKRKYHGTMHVFIVRTKDVEEYGWEKVKEDNMVLQRYDITYRDIIHNREEFFFPPTPRMKDLEMWPPYGTYPIVINK